MTITFVIGAFVIGAFLLVPLGILVAFALMREPGCPATTLRRESGAVSRRNAAPVLSRSAELPRGRATL